MVEFTARPDYLVPPVAPLLQLVLPPSGRNIILLLTGLKSGLVILSGCVVASPCVKL